MPAPTDAVRETLILAGSLFAITAFLAGRLVLERLHREPPDPSEAAYFRGRDRRRALVAAILGSIAGLLALSARIEVRAGVAQARLWAWLMMAVLLLALVLLVLALLDWRANHVHALRQGRALVEEQRQLLVQAIKRHQSQSDLPNTNGPRPTE